MRNSKFSNASSSKYPSSRIVQEICQQHDGQPYTNFCSSATCVRPLCPECIQNHYTHHKNLRTQPQIDSFKSLKNKCSRKLWEMLDKVDGQGGQDSAEELNNIFLQSIRKVRQVRQDCKSVIENYFISLEDMIRKKMTVALSDQSDVFVELQKANSIINELKVLQTKLEESKTFLTTALTISKLDTQKIEDKIKQSFKAVKKFKDFHQFSFNVEKNYQQKIVSFLSKIIYYGNQQNVQKKAIEQVQRTYDENRRSGVKRTNSDEKLSKASYVSQVSSQNNREKDYQKNDDRQSLSRRSSQSEKPPKKAIIGMNTFKQSSNSKYLHFFQNDENILHFLDLQNDVRFSQIQLDINFKIPQFHKSISTPNGDLYVIGGSLPNSTAKSPKIYRYDFAKKTLIYSNSLKYGRSSHSVCFNSKYIYIMGGFTDNQVITNKCERYDIINNKVQEIRGMNVAVCSFACCSLNGRFIYKFGGITEDNSISHQIQIYDEKQGFWNMINPSVDLQGQKLLCLSTSAAIQITQNQIMVMGGYDQDNEGHNQTYILRVQPSGYQIRDINMFPLPQAQGFWNNTPILQNKLVFALQNVSTSQDECVEDVRKILVFDGSYWKCLNP